MDPATSSLLKLENHHEYYDPFWFPEQLPPLCAWEPYMGFPDGFSQCLCIDQCQCLHQFPIPQSSSQTSYSEFKDFEEICRELGWRVDVDYNMPLEDNMVLDAKPLNTNYDNVGRVLGNSHSVKWRESCSSSSSLVSEDHRQSGRYKSGALELDEIQKYFDVPITKAAKELKVGLTVLKKRCRELNIRRWPHRKIKSLEALIKNVTELGLVKEVEMLEQHKRMLQELPEMELNDRTKRLRQACFKANYKKRRALSQLAYS